MRAYDFSTHNKTVKRDKSSYFSYAFIFLLVAALGVFVYYVVLNSPRILFYFRENKYAEIERRHDQAVAAAAGNKADFFQVSEVAEFLELARALQKDHGEDPILFFHEATVLAEGVRRQISEKNQALYFLLFREFIGRPVFPEEFDRVLWQRALVTARRARALGLADVLAQKLSEVETDIYLLGGRPWWESAHRETPLASPARKLPAWHLMQAHLAASTPDFALIQAAYGKSIATLSKSVYYARSGNSPLAISALRELSRDTADAFARDHALYILGYLSGREKRLRDQASYYTQIRFAEFAPQNPYFAGEYHYLLRFLGQKSEADQLMKAWEEMKEKKAE